MATRLPRLYHRMPTVFGPFPGPRQSFDGRRHNGAISQSIEAYITFTARQSDLASMLPPHFSFQKPGPNAFVTLAPKQRSNLEWLGGRGYNLLNYYIHGVQVTGKDNQVYRGTYLPVLWENFADPIVSGREELGYPKLFADLALEEPDDNSYAAVARWQSTPFADFHLRGLRPDPNNTALRPLAPAEAGIIDDGILLWRYVPATGQPGEADAAYPVFVSHDAEAQLMGPWKPQIVRRTSTKDGSFSWKKHNWQALPTLHHVVARLAEVKVLDVVACGVMEKRGGGDQPSAWTSRE